MDIFINLFTNLIPLYILIAMGFAGARYLDVNLHSMATVVIYFLSPVVVFGGIVQIEFQLSYLLLPIILFMISAVIGICAYIFGKKVFPSSPLSNLIGMTSTNGNSGYFGLPIVLAIYGPGAAGVYLMMTTFIELCTNTVGYYILARGNFSVKESIVKVIKLPPLHGMILGLFWNFMQWPLPEVFFTYWDRFTGAWVVIGMMLIGIALGKQPFFKINWKLFTCMMSMRYLIWPIVMFAFVMLDVYVLQLFNGQIYTLLLLLAVIPHAANGVALAAQLKVCPEDTATVVLISTVFGLFFVPFAFWIMGAHF